jgi:hypothetical protein
MFRALLPHLQEALHKQQLAYCVRVMSVGCTRRTQYTTCCLRSASWRWASSGQIMYRPLIHNKLTTESASRWFCYTDILQCTVNKTIRLYSTNLSATQAFFFSTTARKPLVSQGFVTVQASRSHLVRLLRTSDQPVEQTPARKHTTLTRDGHKIAGGIRTRNPRTRLRLRGHRDRLTQVTECDFAVWLRMTWL